jgi:hypothetical protein
MGIKDLMKSLLDYEVFDNTNGYTKKPNSPLFLDYNYIFHTCRYSIRTIDQINTFPLLIANRIHNIHIPNNNYNNYNNYNEGKDSNEGNDSNDSSNTYPLIIVIDKGKINVKDKERLRRKQSEPRAIDVMIMEHRLLHEQRSLNTLMSRFENNNSNNSNNESNSNNSNNSSNNESNSNNETSYPIIEHYPYSDHAEISNEVSELIRLGHKLIVIHANQFDAEYSIILLAKYIDPINSTIISGDQDTIALMIINIPRASIIYRNSLYQLIQDRKVIKLARFIVFCCVIINKSDYFEGINYLTCVTFLASLDQKHDFSIRKQSKSNSIIYRNQELMCSIINSCKNKNNKYYDNDDFTDFFVKYIRDVCQFLRLDTDFYLQ